MSRLLVVLACLVLPACASEAKGSKSPSTKDQEAVRSWLKENLGEPTWEEIRWEGPVSATKRDVDAQEKYLRDNPDATSLPNLRTKPRRFVKLKLRYTDGAFGRVVREKVFDVTDKEAAEVPYSWKSLAAGNISTK